jgi:hypothetical protein
MVVKVLGIAALGGGFVWWQFRDLAREKKRTAARRAEHQQLGEPPR